MTTAVQPKRDTSRDGSSVRSVPTCPLCPAPLPSSRARYCSAACRQRSFVAHTVYECSVCGERSVGEKRCQDCHLFSRAVGLGGHCAECDQPILLAELLELEIPQ